MFTNIKSTKIQNRNKAQTTNTHLKPTPNLHRQFIKSIYKGWPPILLNNLTMEFAEAEFFLRQLFFFPLKINRLIIMSGGPTKFKAELKLLTILTFINNKTAIPTIFRRSHPIMHLLKIFVLFFISLEDRHISATLQRDA
ncbi:hypothetical protein AAZX31_18G132700 [Glycine max]